MSKSSRVERDKKKKKEMRAGKDANNDDVEVKTEEEKTWDELLARFRVDREQLTKDQKLKFQSLVRDRREIEQRNREWDAYWERRKKDDKDLWRDKDFANAVDKNSRAGYKGKHGDFDVPEEHKRKLEGFFMQVTVGDYDGNSDLPCADEWQKHVGMDRITAQREYISHTNWCLTRWGWNPPPGWV